MTDHYQRIRKEGFDAEEIVLYNIKRTGIRVAERTSVYLDESKQTRVDCDLLRTVLRDHPQEQPLLDLAKRMPFGWPDIICRGNVNDPNKLLFIEIKTKNSRPSDWQFKMANELGKLGFDVQLQRDPKKIPPLKALLDKIKIVRKISKSNIFRL